MLTYRHWPEVQSFNYQILQHDLATGNERKRDSDSTYLTTLPISLKSTIHQIKSANKAEINHE